MKQDLTPIKRTGYALFALFIAMILWIVVQLLQGCSGQSFDVINGKDGHNCYDSLGDINNDGSVNELDCQGAPGNDGNIGPSGPTGSVGPKGSPGIGCDSIDVENGVLIVCEYSTVLVRDGKNGKDATPVKMIKFCPNALEKYPTNFPEYGICLDNKIYAIYWDKTAFMTILPPGTYSTTSINNNCIFTVKENSCEIKNN